jgi:hypothetical protein
VYFDNASQINIIADNVTGSDNVSGILGSGVTGYYFTDNATRGAALTDNTTLSDNSSVWSAAMPPTVTLDNTSDGVHTIYGYVKDAAGNISDNTSQTITLDTNAPVIDNLTWDNGTGFNLASDAKSGNATIYLYMNDNETANAGNFSSGIKDFLIQHEVFRRSDNLSISTEKITYSDDNVSSATFTSISDASIAVNTDNLSFDNVSYVLTFNQLNSYVTFPDNLTIQVRAWFRDNASNISDNKTWFFRTGDDVNGSSSM